MSLTSAQEEDGAAFWASSRFVAFIWLRSDGSLPHWGRVVWLCTPTLVKSMTCSGAVRVIGSACNCWNRCGDHRSAVSRRLTPRLMWKEWQRSAYGFWKATRGRIAHRKAGAEAQQQRARAGVKRKSDGWAEWSSVVMRSPTGD